MMTAEISSVVSRPSARQISLEEGAAKVRRALKHAGTAVPILMSRQILAIHLKLLGYELPPPQKVVHVSFLFPFFFSRGVFVMEASLKERQIQQIGTIPMNCPQPRHHVQVDDPTYYDEATAAKHGDFGLIGSRIPHPDLVKEQRE